MELTPTTAICPLDGRYANKVQALREQVSEFALIRNRVLVEVQWFLHLSANPDIEHIAPVSTLAKNYLVHLCATFSEKEADRVKAIEQTTNHDVKAVEYFIKEKMREHPELAPLQESIHFACTSEDINNLAYALMINSLKHQTLLPALDHLLVTLQQMAHAYADVAMLSRTHGQPASPTTLGKEIAVFVHRLTRQRSQLLQGEILGKINGAVGNYNAHYIAYPQVNWPGIAESFVTSLGLKWNPYTTQIEPHDYIAEFAHVLMRIDTILTDFCRDIWGYISLGYFKQKLKENEVGSSTMPHKVNPIDFENAEGNLGMAHAMLQHLANKLPISRFQRDLTDSTSLRNLGLSVAYGQLALSSISQGLSKLVVDHTVLAADLDQVWEVLGEAIQTVLRKYQIDNAYEQLKTLTRGKKITPHDLSHFIDGLALPEEVKRTLKTLRPATYIGNAATQAHQI